MSKQLCRPPAPPQTAAPVIIFRTIIVLTFNNNVVVPLTLLRYSTRYYSHSRTSTQACQLQTLPCFDLEGKCCGMGSINEINRKIRT